MIEILFDLIDGEIMWLYIVLIFDGWNGYDVVICSVLFSDDGGVIDEWMVYVCVWILVVGVDVVYVVFDYDVFESLFVWDL